MPTVLALCSVVVAGLAMLAARRSARNSGRSADAAEHSRDMAVRANHRAEEPEITARVVVKFDPYLRVLLTSDRDLDSMNVSLIQCEVDGKRSGQFLTAMPAAVTNVAAGVLVTRCPNFEVLFQRVSMGKPVEVGFSDWRGDLPRKSFLVRFAIVCRRGDEEWRVLAEGIGRPDDRIVV